MEIDSDSSSASESSGDEYIPSPKAKLSRKRVYVKKEPKSPEKMKKTASTSRRKPVAKKIKIEPNSEFDSVSQELDSEKQNFSKTKRTKSIKKEPNVNDTVSSTKSIKKETNANDIVASSEFGSISGELNKEKQSNSKRKRQTKSKEPNTKAAAVPNVNNVQIESLPTDIISGSTSSITPSNNFNFSQIDHTFLPPWKDEDIIAETTQVPVVTVKNIIGLLEKECTIPFIARYRKEMTGNLPVEKIREVQESYDSIKTLHKRVDNILKTLEKQENQVDQKVVFDFLNATTPEEVEVLYAPFKPGSKKSLAERSKKLGLEPAAKDLLFGKMNYHPNYIKGFINPEIKGLTTEAEVIKGIQHIIADIMSKDKEILDFINHHHQRQFIEIHSTKSAAALKNEKKDFVEGKENQNFKFENYFNFHAQARTINPHQVLALNRGEHLKILTLKLVLPLRFKEFIMKKIENKYIYAFKSIETQNFIKQCSEDAMSRLLEPQIFRQIRSELTKKAIKESCNVFCSNLKRMLLTPPVRGKTVIGIDPGFKHGCKIAVVSYKGDVLQTDVIYPHTKFKNNKNTYEDVEKLIHMVTIYKASIIAIGNGTACRETESWLSNLIKNKTFSPLDVKYCIVNESGASIYSVTKQAEEDLPGLDPNIRSAVSIARRLQDPLLEYVKIEPKHLGVGMYQHDIPEAMLKNSLDSVVVECVSFVGVDLNVCPAVLLKKISGLNETRAKKIIEWRQKNGCFINREQLLEVKGLGPKSFEQCAGFVKILSQTSLKSNIPVDQIAEVSTKKSKKKLYDHNPLDSTIIHPESYKLAEQLLSEMKTNILEIGKSTLQQKVKDYMMFTNVEAIAEKFQVPSERVKLIIDVFLRPIEYDIREEFSVPVFKTGVTSLEDLKVNQELTGVVRNVTHFGAFVDIGVGPSGLIHVSKMRRQVVQLGDTVTVSVLSVDIPRKRISLALVAS